MERPILRVALVLAVCITAAVLLTDVVPLGVPGEWIWARVPLTPEGLAGTFLAAIAGAVYIGFALLGARRIECSGRIERCAWLTALVACGFAWTWTALDSAPATQGYARVPWVLYYPRSSGYFWQARYEVRSTREFLAGYEDLLARQDYLHIGTHPPGLTLAYRGLLQLCRSSPTLTDALLATQPIGFHDAVASIRETPLAGIEPITPTDAGCLWLAALITQLAAVLTSIGLYGLAVRHHDRRIAWLAACVWPLVPAALVFFPKSDVLYALPAVAAAWLWLTACDRQSIVRAVLAGLVLWVGMMLSLAFVTVMGLIGVMTLWEAWTRRRQPTVAPAPFLSVRFVGAAALGFILPTLLLGLTSHINLLHVWSWNLSNHALFYEHNVRTRWTWLIVNPLELSLAVGLPIVVVAAWGVGNSLRCRLLVPASSAAVSFLVVWGLLWLSGKNMGEAARLWILLMPWLVLMAADGLAAGGATVIALSSTTEATRPRTWLGTWLLVAQLLVTLVTIMRIDGFHFAELLTK